VKLFVLFPLGKYNAATDTHTAFAGVLDGNNYTVSNLYMNRTTTTGTGLVGFLYQPGMIMNIGVTNASIIAGDSSQMTGILVGLAGALGAPYTSTNYATIINAYTSGTITAGNSVQSVGGLAGYTYQYINIANSYSIANITAGTLVNFIGGFIGATNSATGASTITTSYSAGSITVASTEAGTGGVGGFAGNLAASINNSYSTANVTILGSGINIGGFGGSAGGNDPTITKTYASGKVIGGTATNVGGYVGRWANSANTLTNSVWDTDATGQSRGFGSNAGTITSLRGGCFGSTCNIAPTTVDGTVTGGTAINLSNYPISIHGSN